jgi:hypothetical protein
MLNFIHGLPPGLQPDCNYVSVTSSRTAHRSPSARRSIFPQLFSGQMDELKIWKVARARSRIKRDLGFRGSASNGVSGGVSQDGVIIGDSTTASHSWIAAPVQFGNKTLVFDGIDDQVIIPANPAYDLTGGGTVEFWVNPSTLSSYFATALGNRGPGGVRDSEVPLF